MERAHIIKANIIAIAELSTEIKQFESDPFVSSGMVVADLKAQWDFKTSKANPFNYAFHLCELTRDNSDTSTPLRITLKTDSSVSADFPRLVSPYLRMDFRKECRITFKKL